MGCPLNLGHEQEVRAGGKTWTLGRLTVDVVLGFRDWIKEQLGDPFTNLERVFDRLPREEQIARVKEIEAIDKQLKNFSLQSPLANEWRSTELGAAKLFQLLLKEHHPQATMDDGLLVCLALGEKGQAEEALAKAQGALPESGGNPQALAALTSGRRRGLKAT